jgi:hypothetical protein
VPLSEMFGTFALSVGAVVSFLLCFLSKEKMDSGMIWVVLK